MVSPKCADSQARKSRVGGKQREVFRQTLRGQQTIERVLVTGRKRQHPVGVIRCDRENLADA
jgi:hypothetical protein